MKDFYNKDHKQHEAVELMLALGGEMAFDIDVCHVNDELVLLPSVSGKSKIPVLIDKEGCLKPVRNYALQSSSYGFANHQHFSDNIQLINYIKQRKDSFNALYYQDSGAADEYKLDLFKSILQNAEHGLLTNTQVPVAHRNMNGESLLNSAVYKNGVSLYKGNATLKADLIAFERELQQLHFQTSMNNIKSVLVDHGYAENAELSNQKVLEILYPGYEVKEVISDKEKTLFPVRYACEKSGGQYGIVMGDQIYNKSFSPLVLPEVMTADELKIATAELYLRELTPLTKESKNRLKNLVRDEKNFFQSAEKNIEVTR